VDYVIPGNDDAIRAIQLYSQAAADAILAGQEQRQLTIVSGDDDFVEIKEEPVAVKIVAKKKTPVAPTEEGEIAAVTNDANDAGDAGEKPPVKLESKPKRAVRAKLKSAGRGKKPGKTDSMDD
jgi:small subunit ribosomal protein S2